jgi:hypothetical protein
MAMDPNDGRVDHGVFHVRLITDRVKHSLENVGRAPGRGVGAVGKSPAEATVSSLA